VLSKGATEPMVPVTSSHTISQSASSSSAITLPFDIISENSAFKLAPSNSPATRPKRKSSEDLSGSGEAPAKRNRSGTDIHGRVGHQLLELGVEFANITKGPLHWFLPRPPGVPRLPHSFAWSSNKVPNTTSTASSVTESPPSAASVEEVRSETPSNSEDRAARGLSQWGLPSKFPGLGARVNACDYALKKSAEEEKYEAESRLDLKKTMKEVQNHACPPCEQCERCWLF
jgi:hypothetical protein